MKTFIILALFLALTACIQAQPAPREYPNGWRDSSSVDTSYRGEWEYSKENLRKIAICNERGHVWGTAFVTPLTYKDFDPWQIVDSADVSYELMVYDRRRTETTCQRCGVVRTMLRNRFRHRVIWRRPE